MKWIDLKDRVSGARLKHGAVDGVNALWIVGLSNTSPRWQKAIEKLGFTASPNRKFLIRPTRPEDKSLTASSFHSVWPDAAVVEMERESVYLDLVRSVASTKAITDEERDLKAELHNSRRLGRNTDGDEIYHSAAGRFIYRESNGITRETHSLRPAMFMYAPDAAALDVCADGFVKSMLMGEVQRSDDFDRFLSAVNAAPGEPLAAQFSAKARSSISRASSSPARRAAR